jgi:hypothetical protein
MEGSGANLTRVGAWGQIAAVGLVGLTWHLQNGAGFYLACAGYLIATVLGIVGIIRAEEILVSGPILYPFIVPGFVPLYYFAMKL